MRGFNGDPMNPEVKALWVAALRSGEYQQASGQLAYRGDENEPWRHCCLGVLCEVAVKAGVDVPVSDRLMDRYYDGANALLPDSVIEWAGLHDDSPSFIAAGGSLHSLTAKNDNGTPFAEIADLIEKYL